MLTCIIPILSLLLVPKSFGFVPGFAPEPLTDTTYCLGSIDVAFSAVSSSFVNDHLFAESSYPIAVPFVPSVLTIKPPSPLDEPLEGLSEIIPKSFKVQDFLRSSSDLFKSVGEVLDCNQSGGQCVGQIKKFSIGYGPS